MTAAPVVLGLDLGTSALKGVALDQAGEQVAQARAAYPTSRPAPGRAQQDPADWQDALESVVGMLIKAIPGDVAGIGLSGMIPTLVLLDSQLAAVGPAVTWEDNRADPEAQSLAARLGAENLYRSTGQWIDGRYLLPMFRWLTTHEPGRTARAVWLTSAKDYLFSLLTGELATDPSTASGYGCFDLASASWDARICREVGITPDGESGGRVQLPPVRPSLHASPLRPSSASRLGLTAGVPVTLGGADSVLGALAVGADQSGHLAHLAGTSTVILMASEQPVLDPQHRWLVTPMAGNASWGMEMDLLATGSALAWLGKLFGVNDDPAGTVLALAATLAPARSEEVFLPYLGFGEQGALWDPSLRGMVAGLSLATEQAHLARALIDGILVETRRCVSLLSDQRLPTEGLLHVGGWGADSAEFLSWLAAATERPVSPPAPGVGSLPSAVGAARLAASSLGWAPPRRNRFDAQVVGAAAEEVEAWRQQMQRHERWRAAFIQ